MTTKTTHRPFILTILVVTLFLSYNFINAAWTAPSANPPTNNTEAPINVSTTSQMKNGRLNLRYGTNMATNTTAVMFQTNGAAVGNIFAASSQMRSNLYCNSVGQNCSDANDIYTTIYSTSTEGSEAAFVTNRTNAVNNLVPGKTYLFFVTGAAADWSGASLSKCSDPSTIVAQTKFDTITGRTTQESHIIPYTMPANTTCIRAYTRGVGRWDAEYVVAIEASGSIPTGGYVWRTEAWGYCSGGTQTRTVTCNNTLTDAVVAASNCTATKPATSQSCATNTGDSHGN